VFAHGAARPPIRPQPNRSENDGGVESFKCQPIAAVILQSRASPGMVDTMTLRTIGKLKPMHYAALAGRGIILIQQGKDARVVSR
jgi:hypothetical protein